MHDRQHGYRHHGLPGERIEEKVREMREVGGPALREKFEQEAAAIWMTIDEIVQTGTKRCGRPPKDRDEG